MPGEGSPVHCAEQLRQTAAVSHAYDSAWEQITRTLVVTSKSPWPSMNGAAIRSAEVVRSLTRHGDVDLAIIGESDAEAPPSALGLRRSHVFPLDRHSRFRARVNRVGALAGGLAVPVAASDYRTARRQLERWAASDYDVVWFGGVEVATALGGVARAPAICDLMDLEDFKIAADLALRRGARDGGRRRARIREVSGRLEVAAWRRAQRAVSRRSAVVAVCSELDRARLAQPNALVVPNTYPEPRSARERIEPASPPTITFVGSLAYPPNRDAVHFLAHEIAPTLRRDLPGVAFRLVGRSDQSVADAAEGLTIVGPVADLEPELARADLIVAPVRYGSGTRMKILEAFAHRIPVVATTAAAEGLDVVDGVHLLLADDGARFAAACVRALRDLELRRRLVAAADDLYRSRYTAAQLDRAVDDVLRTAVAPRAQPGGSGYEASVAP